MQKPTANSFFCGAGGFDCGLIQAGFRIVGAWDFDKYAVQSYKHNIGDHVKQADISQMTAQDVPRADVWTFGFPCQDLSVAGKQAGMQLRCVACDEVWTKNPASLLSSDNCPKCDREGRAATRSGLFFEVMRLLDETLISDKPRILVAENVKGLKPYLPVLAEEYAKRGYTMHVKLFNSKYWGVPQNRERYFVVGVREGIAGFEFPEECKTNIPKLSSILESVVDEKYYVSDDKARKIIEQAMQKVELKDVHACITPDRLDKRQNGPRAKENEEPMFTLTRQDLHGVIEIEPQIMNVANSNPSGRGMSGACYHAEGLAPTLTTNKGEGIKVVIPQDETQGGHRQPKVFDYSRYRVRRLTPKEYSLLQGFPDTWQQVVSDSQAYKQFGNAVTTFVAQAVAESIAKVLKPKRIW